MKLKHCNTFLKVSEIWILKDNEKFIDRKIHFAFCPICDLKIVTLEQYSIVDNRVFETVLKGKSIKTILEKEKMNIKQKQSSSNNRNKMYGWVYGINSEIKNKSGKVVQVRQYSKSMENKSKKLEKKIQYKV